MNSLFSDRYNIPNNRIKTYAIAKDMYIKLYRVCQKYRRNMAYSYPSKHYWNENLIIGVSDWDVNTTIKYLIPDLYYDVYEFRPRRGLIRPKYNQYALLDYIEFVAKNIRTISEVKTSSDGLDVLIFDDSEKDFRLFREEINNIFSITGLQYNLTLEKKIERLTSYDEIVESSFDQVSIVHESGLRQLLFEAVQLYKNPRPDINKLALDKVWDAFERLKTIYVDADIDKKHSVAEVVSKVSCGREAYGKLIDDEFKSLTTIGNTFRIRHHELDKIDLCDDNYVEYLFSRCFSLIALAIKYI